ncbi:hypothetical protein TNCV_1946121 [Trichonephila clavipes]|uniref:Uncharacterized protein n=1 Tax=Trichonephila clavipes TaxID=2585209 RepID=A0A8X6S9T9_TRICX|nr:hypothetical protein TNCV_1946121 [Trichonephila clavipes]
MGRRLHLLGNVDDIARQLEQIWQEISQETALYRYATSCGSLHPRLEGLPHSLRNTELEASEQKNIQRQFKTFDQTSRLRDDPSISSNISFHSHGSSVIEKKDAECIFVTENSPKTNERKFGFNASAVLCGLTLNVPEQRKRNRNDLHLF